METVLLTFVLPYLISLAANERSTAIHARREDALKRALSEHRERDARRDQARSLREELRAACIELARSQDAHGVGATERPLWRLLGDDLFQADLSEWLMAGDIVESEGAKLRLSKQIEQALVQGGASAERLEFARAELLDAVDKVVFAHPVLAHWRHQQSLDYLRQQNVKLRELAEQSVGLYSEEARAAALEHYRAKALAAWDIIDLGLSHPASAQVGALTRTRRGHAGGRARQDRNW